MASLTRRIGPKKCDTVRIDGRTADAYEDSLASSQTSIAVRQAHGHVSHKARSCSLVLSWEGVYEEDVILLCKRGASSDRVASIEVGRGGRFGARVGLRFMVSIETFRLGNGVRNSQSSNCWMKYVRKARARRPNMNEESAA